MTPSFCALPRLEISGVLVVKSSNKMKQPFETIDSENHLNWLISEDYKHTYRPHLQRSETDKRYINNFCDVNGTSIAQFWKEEEEARAEGLPTYGEKYWTSNDFCLAYWNARSTAKDWIKGQMTKEKFDKLNYSDKLNKLIDNDSEVLRLRKALNLKCEENEKNNPTEKFEIPYTLKPKTKELIKKFKEIQTSGQLSLFA